jgi:DNA polymerase III delta prime subunit
MTSMNPAVLAIAGPTGSGKTTTAALLAQQLGWPHDGYGDTIRATATARGLPASRSILQQLGVELTGTGWGSFTRLVLGHARWHHGSRSSWTACATCPQPPPSARPSPRSPASSSTWTCPPAPPSPAPRRRDRATGPGAGDAQHVTELGLPTARDHADPIIHAPELEPAQVAGQVICYLVARLGRAPGGRYA